MKTEKAKCVPSSRLFAHLRFVTYLMYVHYIFEGHSNSIHFAVWSPGYEASYMNVRWVPSIGTIVSEFKNQMWLDSIYFYGLKRQPKGRTIDEPFVRLDPNVSGGGWGKVCALLAAIVVFGFRFLCKFDSASREIRWVTSSRAPNSTNADVIPFQIMMNWFFASNRKSLTGSFGEIRRKNRVGHRNWDRRVIGVSAERL